MMITLAIMSIVMAGAFQVIQEGMQLYRTYQMSADAQTSVLKIASRISAELTNASPIGTKSYSLVGAPADPGPPPRAAVPPDSMAGLVFATSIAAGGGSLFHPVTGAVAWQRYICFYFEPDPTGGYNGRIMRAEQPIPTHPPVSQGDTDLLGRVQDWILDPSHGPAYFQTSGAVERRLIADNISGFDVQLYRGEVGSRSTGVTAARGADLVRRSYNIYVQAGDRDKAMRNSYYIRVDSKVTPRG